MKSLFRICIRYNESENGHEYPVEHLIGFFHSLQEAKTIANSNEWMSLPAYQAIVTEVSLLDADTDIEYLYSFYGQNIDPSLSDDLIESPYYANKANAIQEMIKAKKRTPRQQWELQTYKVGEPIW